MLQTDENSEVLETCWRPLYGWCWSKNRPIDEQIEEAKNMGTWWGNEDDPDEETEDDKE